MSTYSKNFNLFTDLIKADRSLFPKLKTPEDIKPKLDKVKDKHLFLDSMVGSVGNIFAYHNIIHRYDNSGIHIAVNANSFNDINSQFGTKVGDNAIQMLFKAIVPIAQKHQMPVFRTRGDEARLLALDEESAKAFSDELSQALDQQEKVKGQHKLSVSIGIGHTSQAATDSLSYAKHQLAHQNSAGQVERLAKPGEEKSLTYSSLSKGAPPDWRPILGAIDFGYVFDDTLVSPGLKLAKPLDKSEGLDKGVMSRIAPFNPQKDRLSGYEEGALADWQLGTATTNDEVAPRTGATMSGAPAKRALHNLSGKTPSRMNENGEREFLLHRGMSDEEHQKIHSPENITHPDVVRGGSAEGYVNHEDLSSWTPNRSTAKNFATQYDGFKNVQLPSGPAMTPVAGKVVSAWVPESSINMIPKQYGKLDINAEMGDDEDYKPPQGLNEYRGEHEVVVNAHHNSKKATFEEVQSAISPRSTLHGRINIAGKDAQLSDDPGYRVQATKERLQGLKPKKP